MREQTYVTVFSEERRKDGCFYQYRLLSRKDDNEEIYSLFAIMKTSSGEETSAMAYDVFRSLEQARAFFLRIVSFLATPINLPYVVEDEISSF